MNPHTIDPLPELSELLSEHGFQFEWYEQHHHYVLKFTQQGAFHFHYWTLKHILKTCCPQGHWISSSEFSLGDLFDLIKDADLLNIHRKRFQPTGVRR